MKKGKTCHLYDESNLCYTCEEGYIFLDIFSSDYTDIKDNYSTERAKCLLPTSKIQGYTLDSSLSPPKFIKCQSNCIDCEFIDGIKTCKKCQIPLNSIGETYLDPLKNECVSCDQPGEYKKRFNGVCNSCPIEGCLDCVDETKCLKCDDPTHFMSLDEKVCFAECPSLFYRDYNQKKCLPCVENCNYF